MSQPLASTHTYGPASRPWDFPPFLTRSGQATNNAQQLSTTTLTRSNAQMQTRTLTPQRCPTDKHSLASTTCRNPQSTAVAGDVSPLFLPLSTMRAVLACPAPPLALQPIMLPAVPHSLPLSQARVPIQPRPPPPAAVGAGLSSAPGTASSGGLLATHLGEEGVQPRRLVLGHGHGLGWQVQRARLSHGRQGSGGACPLLAAPCSRLACLWLGGRRGHGRHGWRGE